MFSWPRAAPSRRNTAARASAWSRPGSCAHFHDGIDIADRRGTLDPGRRDGVVAFTGYRADGALVVVMGHAGGYETVYAHRAARPCDQAVRKSAGAIGSMGCSGIARTPSPLGGLAQRRDPGPGSATWHDGRWTSR